MSFDELDESSIVVASPPMKNFQTTNNEVNSSKLEHLHDTIIYLTNVLAKSNDRNKILSNELKEINIELDQFSDKQI